MTIAMMIDIETLSLRPDAYVTQVGYCVTDLDTGRYLIEPMNVWLEDHDQRKRHKDISTIQWWMNQDRKVVASVFNDAASRTPSWELYHNLEADIEKYEVTEVWASPAMFDLPILTSLWDGAKPWKYNQERCLMTFYKLMDPNGLLLPPPNDMYHDAAADAKWQMHYLINLHQKFRGNANGGSLL